MHFYQWTWHFNDVFVHCIIHAYLSVNFIFLTILNDVFVHCIILTYLSVNFIYLTILNDAFANFTKILILLYIWRQYCKVWGTGIFKYISLNTLDWLCGRHGKCFGGRSEGYQMFLFSIDLKHVALQVVSWKSKNNITSHWNYKLGDWKLITSQLHIYNYNISFRILHIYFR